MIDLLGKMLSYPFMVRAFVVGGLVSLCAALLGVSLVLKRYSMIGDGLSHVGFGAVAVAASLGLAPLKLAIPVVIVAAFLLLRLNGKSRMGGDAAIALVSTASLAVGVTMVSLTSGMTTDVENYMFGSILAVESGEVTLSVVLCAAVLGMYLVCYHRIFAVTCDETFARATGVRTGLYDTLLAVMTAVTVVLGMRMMGALLISSLIVFPALSAMQLCRRFKSVILCSALTAVLCFGIGMTLSYLLATPAGASVVLVNLLFYALCRGISALRERAKG